jgi:hypothetical protein
MLPDSPINDKLQPVRRTLYSLKSTNFEQGDDHKSTAKSQNKLKRSRAGPRPHSRRDKENLLRHGRKHICPKKKPLLKVPRERIKGKTKDERRETLGNLHHQYIAAQKGEARAASPFCVRNVLTSFCWIWSVRSRRSLLAEREIVPERAHGSGGDPAAEGAGRLGDAYEEQRIVARGGN